jgi:hypothetical protein
MKVLALLIAAFAVGAFLGCLCTEIRCAGHVAKIRRSYENAHMAHFSRGFSEGVASVREADVCR